MSDPLGEGKPGSVQCCFTSTETCTDHQGLGAQDGHIDCHTAPELCGNNVFFSYFNVALRPQRPVRDGEPRTATSTFTQLLVSVETRLRFSVALCPQRPNQGRRAQDSPLDFHTAPRLCGNEVQIQFWLVGCCFTSTEIVGLLGTGDQDGHSA